MKLEVQKQKKTKNYNVKESLIINAKGVTLIALVITIIILLILGGITIATLTGENGLFARAKQAKQNYSISSAKEKLQLAISDLMVEQTSKGENLTKEDLPKINNDEIDVKSTETFPVEVICENYIFSVDENFTVTYVREASGTVVTFTTEPENYTNKGEVKILVKISNPKGIKSIQKPRETDRILAQGQKEVGIDYKVTKNGHYIFTIVDEEGKETVKDIYIDLIDKLEPLDFTPEIQKDGSNITIIENGQDAESDEISTKSGIDYYEYYIIDSNNKETKYETNKIKNLAVGNYKVYVIAYDRARNSKKSNIIQLSIERKIKMISTGYYHSLVIDEEGHLWTWGYNNKGQIGYGTKEYETSPVPILTETKFKQISAGGYHCIAQDEEGKLWVWGDNEYGQLGTGTTIKQLQPTKIELDIKFKEISSSNYCHSLAIDEEENLWAWGNNECGQLGDGTMINKTSPIKIKTETKFIKISVGRYFSLAIDEEGHLWAWGLNNYGQLGDGTTDYRTRPVKIKSETKFKRILAGDYHSLAIDAEGNLWAWGENNYGQLGDGTKINKKVPVQVKTNIKYKEIAAGDGTNLAIDEEGYLWAWGYNSSGELGDGTTENKISPIKIKPETKFKQISRGYGHSLAIDEEGSLWAWGYNGSGALGDGTTENKKIPVKIIY